MAAQRLTLDGTVRGRSIDLDSDTGIPDGTRVQVTVESPPLSLDERRAAIRRLCGVWSDDPSIEEVFREIARERSQRLPRDVDFDSQP